MNELNLIKELIASIGFPVFVAVYLLVYFRKTVQRLEKAVTALTDAINRLCSREGK